MVNWNCVTSLPSVGAQLRLIELNVREEWRRRELTHESRERLDVDRTAHETYGDGVLGNLGVEAFGLAGGLARVLGRRREKRDGIGRALRRSRIRDRRDPRERRLRPAHLVEHVRPDVAIAIDRADEIELAQHRVVSRLRAMPIAKYGLPNSASESVSALSNRVSAAVCALPCDQYIHPTTATVTVQTAMVPSSQGSPARANDERTDEKSNAGPRAAFFFRAPGRRLISIIHLSAIRYRDPQLAFTLTRPAEVRGR